MDTWSIFQILSTQLAQNYLYIDTNSKLVASKPAGTGVQLEATYLLVENFRDARVQLEGYPKRANDITKHITSFSYFSIDNNHPYTNKGNSKITQSLEAITELK